MPVRERFVLAGGRDLMIQSHANATSVSQALEAARAFESGRDLRAAFAGFRRALELQPTNVPALRALLRIALRRRYHAAARRMLDSPLRSLEGPEVSMARAQIALRRRDWKLALRLANSALAAPELGETARRPMETVRKQAIALRRAEALPPAGFKHIAIGGVSFSGSTVLAALLGSAPGAFNIGESHHLCERIDSGTAGAGTAHAISGGRFDWTRDDPADLFPCHACGPACAVFDAPFRRSMSKADDWYGRIAARACARLLISSDKNFGFISNNEPLGRLDLIILFKSPAAAWASELKNKSRLRRLGLDRPALHRPVGRYLVRWCENYLSLLRDLNPTGQVVALSWEAFCAAPEWHLHRLAELLRFDLNDDPLRVAEPQHFFGGNIEVRHDQLTGAGRLDVKPAEPTDIPAADRRVIEQDREARYVFSMLRDRYRQAFGGRYLRARGRKL